MNSYYFAILPLLEIGQKRAGNSILLILASDQEGRAACSGLARAGGIQHKGKTFYYDCTTPAAAAATTTTAAATAAAAPPKLLLVLPRKREVGRGREGRMSE